MTKAYPIKDVVDRLAVEIHGDRAAMARAAARAAAAYLRDVIVNQGEARVIFGCAPSQDEFLQALLDPAMCGVALDWKRLVVFHMDEYVGLAADHPQSFRHYLHRHLLSRVAVGRFHGLAAEGPDSAAACALYAGLLSEKAIDLICAGFGENGHLAFNDPPADFNDPALVKIVEMDATCREQQVNDGCFASLEDVPRHALTITLPVFTQARRVSAVVPSQRKAAAVRAALLGAITPACPASILRLHPNATLYLDAAAASQL
jgi:glucosamine-6-phosphate deaminase